MNDFTSAYTVDQDPQAVFDAINDVRSWWTGDIDGPTDQLGGKFAYRYGDIHFSEQKVIELLTGKRVVWETSDADLSFAHPSDEWKGTIVAFEIEPVGTRTKLTFTHIGLVDGFECYEACSNGWGFFVNTSLRRLITTGEGPTPPPWA